MAARADALDLRHRAAPESILCLTFTKAGAAAMAERIGTRLARWVRLSNPDLGRELDELGEDSGPETRERARQLFARVLDAPGGIRVRVVVRVIGPGAEWESGE